jgi:hypothetical protein
LFYTKLAVELLNFLEDEARYPSSAATSVAYSYWLQWRKQRQHIITLKTGQEITVDISHKACKGKQYGAKLTLKVLALFTMAMLH